MATLWDITLYDDTARDDHAKLSLVEAERLSKNDRRLIMDLAEAHDSAAYRVAAQSGYSLVLRYNYDDEEIAAFERAARLATWNLGKDED